MTILRPFTGTGAVFFPEGPPPEGTCVGATPDCLELCYAKSPGDFDEELRVSDSIKRDTLDYFLVTNCDFLCHSIEEDLDGLQTNILHWFGSGDCPHSLVEKIGTIINSLPKRIVQMGFTRNVLLWERHKNVFALTIEEKAYAIDPRAMYSIPDYDEQVSAMYCPSYEVRGGRCGPLTCKDVRRDSTVPEHYINCKTCWRLSTGCFDRRKGF